jgi:hypothetical protein
MTVFILVSFVRNTEDPRTDHTWPWGVYSTKQKAEEAAAANPSQRFEIYPCELDDEASPVG